MCVFTLVVCTHWVRHCVGNQGFWSHKTLSKHFLGIRAGFLALYGHTLYTKRVVSSALVPYRALPPSAQCPSRAQCQHVFFFFLEFSEIRCMTLENRWEPKKKKKKCGLTLRIYYFFDSGENDPEHTKTSHGHWRRSQPTWHRHVIRSCEYLIFTIRANMRIFGE